MPPKTDFFHPRRRWLLPVALALIVVGVLARFAVPIYRQRVAIHEIEHAGGRIFMDAAPRWVEWIVPTALKDTWMTTFFSIPSIDFKLRGGQGEDDVDSALTH